MKIVHYTLESRLSCNYTIVLLADIHGKINADIIPKLREIKPNMICIAGDLVNVSIKNEPEIVIFLRDCVEIAPTYFSLGNHDYHITKDELALTETLGVNVLNDTFVSFNKEIVIGGMTSYFYHKCERYDPKVPMELFPEIKWLDEFEQRKEYKILLDHHPDNYDKYTSRRNIDLILSGHEHGGQIRFFGKGLYGRSQGFFPKYDGGCFEGKLVVSRGLSNTIPIPRLWNPTELVVVDLMTRRRFDGG